MKILFVVSIICVVLQMSTTEADEPDFYWEPCSDARTDLVWYNSIQVTPIPVQLPGTMRIRYVGHVFQELTSPIKLTTHLERKLGWWWFRVPCFGGLGSCTYEDVCERVAIWRVDCPIVRGLHDSNFDLGIQEELFPSFFRYISGLARGHYRAKLEAFLSEQNENEEPFTCINVQFRVG